MMKRKIPVYLCFLLLVCLWCCIYTSFIGEPADGLQMNIEITESEDMLSVTFSHKHPEARLTGVQQQRDGMTLYITARKVAPPFASQQVQLSIPKEAQKEIWLGGKLIWESK